MRENAVSSLAISSLFAGPIFLAAMTLAALYLELPRPVVIRGSDLFLLPVLLPLSAIVGFVPAFVLNLIGGSVMTALSKVGGPARARGAWLAAGAATGGLLVLLFQASGATAAALVATSAACGWMDWKGAMPD